MAGDLKFRAYSSGCTKTEEDRSLYAAEGLLAGEVTAPHPQL